MNHPSVTLSDGANDRLTADRLSQLERSMSRLRRMAVIFASIAILSVLTAANIDDRVPDYLVARKGISLVDLEGRTRVTLRVEPDGLPVLHFYGSRENEPVISLGVHKSATGLFLRDDDGKNRIVIARTDHEGQADESGFFLYDGKGSPRLKATVFDVGLPNIQIYDKTAKSRLLIGADSQGRVLGTLKGVDNRPRVELSVDQNNIGTIRLFDRNGEEKREAAR